MPEVKDKKDTKERTAKSTSEQFAVYEYDDDDLIIMRVDRKDPQRRQIMGAIQAALEAAQRNEEAVRAKAYAQERLPDDWQRKWPSKEDPKVFEPRRPQP